MSIKKDMTRFLSFISSRILLFGFSTGASFAKCTIVVATPIAIRIFCTASGKHNSPFIIANESR